MRRRKRDTGDYFLLKAKSPVCTQAQKGCGQVKAILKSFYTETLCTMPKDGVTKTKSYL